MASLKTIARLLKLKELKLVDFSFHRDKLVRLYVRSFKNGCRCPDCDRRCKIVRTRPKLREWRDLSVGGHRLVFCYFPREIHCPTHGRCEENIPWAAPHSRITYRFEHSLFSLCQSMTQKAAAKLLQTAPSTLSDLLHRSIERHRHGHRIRGLRTLGIDEISYHKRHKYATLIYDLDTSKVIWIGKGRGRDTIDRFFTEALSPWQRQQVRAACCDMSASYIGAIREHCPQATLVLDRFHIVKALNEAVDQVRKQAWREASKHDKKAVKGLRWMLYRHSSTRSRADTAALKALEKSNRRIYRAWRLKDEFEQLWNYRSRWGRNVFSSVGHEVRY
ncbi:ISL3 family transposase [Granulosicoccus sp. 3-233]|uniref:ISL3 family transposase n=1 Tax=Granulosicoccus sp. 3-233 TaxID=3417969 RepID=UPI003D338DB3